jgi:hypothetical protein
MSFWDNFKAGAEEGQNSFIDLVTGLFNLKDNENEGNKENHDK